MKGGEIPLIVQIFQVADIYDALVSARPYRPALTTEQALETMRTEVRQGWWNGLVLNKLEVLVNETTVLTKMAYPRKAWPPMPWVQCKVG